MKWIYAILILEGIIFSSFGLFDVLQALTHRRKFSPSVGTVIVGAVIICQLVVVGAFFCLLKH